MLDLSKVISNLYLSDLMLKYSKNKKEVNNPVVNYHPQTIDDNYYQDSLPTKLTIAEFILDDNTKKDIENDIKQNGIVNFLSSINAKKKIINFTINDQENQNKINENKINSFSVNELLKQIMKIIPQKAFVIKTEHVSSILTQYEKIKQEIGDINNLNNNLIFKRGTIMYDILSTVYNIERNILRVNKYAQEKFVKPFRVDIYGVSNKDFLKNAYYDPINNEIVLGTFLNLASYEIVNASYDTDVVIHELGHKLLDNLRPNYINNQFHFESGAVHEAFSDINAFLNAASDPNIEKYIKENKIDLSKSNLVSQIAEYFGKNIYTNIKQVKELLNTNPYMSKEELSKIKDEKPIRDLFQNFEYKKYSELENKDKKVHLQSKSLSNAVYKAFINFYQDNKNKYSLNESAFKFYDVFIKGTKISNPSTTTIPEFMKSLIVADILFNNSELTPYLLKAANENKIFDNIKVSDILNEINKSKNLNMSDLYLALSKKENNFSEFVKSSEFKKLLKEMILKILKNYSSKFEYLKVDDLDVYLVPGFKGGINIEVSYRYPQSIKFENKEYPVYGGAIFVFDNEMKLIYSYIEDISDQKVKD